MQYRTKFKSLQQQARLTDVDKILSLEDKHDVVYQRPVGRTDGVVRTEARPDLSIHPKIFEIKNIPHTNMYVVYKYI